MGVASVIRLDQSLGAENLAHLVELFVAQILAYERDSSFGQLLEANLNSRRGRCYIERS